jgi:hypothetical protein
MFTNLEVRGSIFFLRCEFPLKVRDDLAYITVCLVYICNWLVCFF